MAKKIGITDTVLRDGHQSLIATRMRTQDMLPGLEIMDGFGYHSLEVWGGATFDSCLRYLDEDPWVRLRKLKLRAKKTKLQMLLRGQNILGYKHYPDDVLEKFIEKAISNGIDIIRIFDALNDPRNMGKSIEYTKKYGGHAQVSFVYTTSPIHKVELFIEKALQFEEMGADSLCIKDMAGLLAPQTAYNLVSELKDNITIPIQLHSHNTSGMAPATYLKAAEAGVDVIDTALASFGAGTSQPPTQTMVSILEDEDLFETGLDLEELNNVDKHFKKVRDKNQQYLSSFTVDPRVLTNQMPGGMLSNLYNQLKEQKILDKYDEVLDEVPRVREELGYPPLVTPTSQIVGTQAVFNVVAGERYKFVSREIKDYIRGMYGRPPGEIDQDLKKKLLEKENLEEINCRPAQMLEPAFDKTLEEIKDIITKEEDVLSYILFPEIAEKFLRAHYS